MNPRVSPNAALQAAPSARPVVDAGRLRRAFEQHFDFVWRSLRRLGLHAAAADDAAQKTFVVLMQRLHEVTPGCERAFLFATATRVASDHRRSAPVRREVLDDSIEPAGDLQPSLEELVDHKRARELLDRLLLELTPALRQALILFELEGMTSQQIAELLEIPLGTVQSRLRRAREQVEAAAARLRLPIPGDAP